MVYLRGWWNYYLCGGFIYGLMSGELFRTKSLFKTVQSHTDGALARYYTQNTWRKMVEATGFKVEYIMVKGSKAEIFPIPGGCLKDYLRRVTPSFVSRFLTNQCGMVSFLISKIIKVG